MPALDLIALDMDGVLTDSTPMHARSYADLWDRIGIEGPEYSAIAGWTTRAAVRRHTAGLGPSPEQIAEWVAFKQARARELIATGNLLYPDVEPALAWMAARGLRLAVGTGASRTTATALLRQGGVLDYFGVLVTADDVAQGKPAPDTFAEAISRAGATPARSLVVEDSSSGLLSGDAAGAWTASVRTGERLDSHRFLGAHADLGAIVHFLERTTT